MSQYAWTLLRAGSFRLDGGGMFGVVPKSIWSRLTDADETNRIGLQTNCLLLDDGHRKVLIETGFGGKWSDRERGFYDLQRRTVVDALADIGVTPEQIDHVVVTHLHFDHAAGLTHLDQNGESARTFARATIHVQQTEWDDARANKSTMTRTYLSSHLEPIADAVRTVRDRAEVLPGIHVLPLPGHTWGQQGVCFEDEAGTVCFPGDVMPTVHHVHPAFSMGYDMLPFENMRTKETLLREAAAEGWRLVLDHEPDDPVVLVEPDPKVQGRYRLVRSGEKTSAGAAT